MGKKEKSLLTNSASGSELRARLRINRKKGETKGGDKKSDGQKRKKERKVN